VTGDSKRVKICFVVFLEDESIRVIGEVLLLKM